jgi:hypothetical protein
LAILSYHACGARTDLVEVEAGQLMCRENTWVWVWDRVRVRRKHLVIVRRVLHSATNKAVVFHITSAGAA